MNKEELKKEAEKFLGGWLIDPEIVKLLVDFAEPREKQIQIDAEHIRALQKQNGELTDKVKELEAQLESERDLPAIAYIQGAEKQKKKDEEELKKWKDEWQEQVQKATDEGYARTLQTIQLTKVKEIIKNLLSAYTTYADSFDDRDNEIVEEACQFISEMEK